MGGERHAPPLYLRNTVKSFRIFSVVEYYEEL
jgi:hypothetical protein